jgi:hypothetical protein
MDLLESYATYPYPFTMAFPHDFHGTFVTEAKAISLWTI